VTLEWLPSDDLPVAKSEHRRTLGLTGDLARLDPPHLTSAESDHGVARLDEPIRDDPWTHVVEAFLEPRARLLVSTQTRPAWDQHLDVSREQRQKPGYVAAVVVELDPTAGHGEIPLRHRLHYRSREEPGGGGPRQRG
jgi:hypothetical protein